MQAGGPPEAELDLTWAPCRRPCRDWYMNGNYLVILVSVSVILPLALMRQLGEHVAGPWGCGQQAAAHSPPPPTGYLGYSSGFSLSCMVFFLIAVSRPPRQSGGEAGWGGSASSPYPAPGASQAAPPGPEASPSHPLPGHLQKVPRALPTALQLG